MKINLPEKRYYSIGEVAKAFEVNTSLLRYWEKEFKQIQPKKNRLAFENLPLVILKIFSLFIIY